MNAKERFKRRIDLLLREAENVFHFFFKGKLQISVLLTCVYIKVKDNLNELKKGNTYNWQLQSIYILMLNLKINIFHVRHKA